MPAAAVIPAPRAYTNVVAVKKPVVGFEIIAFEVCSEVHPLDVGTQEMVMICLMRERTSAETLFGGWRQFRSLDARSRHCE